MLSTEIVKFCQKQGYWFDETTTEYENALQDIGIDLDSDIGYFYLHAEDSTTFLGPKGELFQLCWHIVNTDYCDTIESIRKAFRLSSDYFPLSSVEGQSGYFYNRTNGSVIFLSASTNLLEFWEGKVTSQWGDFSSFLTYFWQL